jgi:hypothetical protein
MERRKPGQTWEEWLATLSQPNPAAVAKLAAARKAEEERARRVNAELDEEYAAEAADPAYRLKKAILRIIGQSKDGPVLRSRLYRDLHGDRFPAFSQALRELLEDDEILQTELREGPRGRKGIAYVPYVPMPQD